MPNDPKPAPERGSDGMVEALEEEERSEHGLPPEPPADAVTPAGGLPPSRER